MSTTEENRAIVKKMQGVVYGILCDIEAFCRENNITYFLSGGSCLGAVRHKGFIPWDDDADLMMPREDYMRFLTEFEKKFGEKYTVGSLYNDATWQRQYARVWDNKSKLVSTNVKDRTMGIFIDIFPIDGVPSGKLSQKFFFRYLDVMNALRNSCVKTEFLEHEKYRTLKNLVSVVTRHISPRWFAIKLDNKARKYAFAKCSDVAASLAVHYGEKEIIPRNCMDKAVYLPFEKGEFPVPIGYEQYLSNLYGDYMTIPKDAEENGYTHLEHWKVTFADDVPSEDCE